MTPSLFQSQSPFVIQESDQSLDVAETVKIKGIFSTDLLDRGNEFVDAMEFNLHVFENTGTVLRNHEFIVDSMGNKHTAGKVLKTVPVVISQENPENSEEWVFKSLVSEDIVAMWPKAKSPNMLVGDRAVYVVAEINHPEVVQQVLNKELGAFSWSGLTHKQEFENGVVALKSVDLLEISLVNIPANPDATFMLTDDDDPTLKLEISLKECEVYQLRFDKDQFPLDSIEKITKNFNINTSEISENETSFFINLGDLVKPVKCFSYDLGHCSAIAAPKMMTTKHRKLETIQTTKLSEELMSEDVTKDSVVEEKVVAEKLYLVDIAELMKAIPKAVVSVQKTITLGEAPVEINFIELPIFGESQEEVVAEEVVEPADETVDQVVEQKEVQDEVEDTVIVDEVVAVAEAPVTDDRLDKLTDLVASLTSVVAENLAKKEETNTVEKSIEDVKAEMTADFEAKLSKFKKDEEAVEAQKAMLQKSLDKLKAFETEVPDETTRSEKTESVKSVQPTEELDAKAFFANLILKGVK